MTDKSLEELEREAIESALIKTGNNYEQAARILGISTKTIRRRLRVWRNMDQRGQKLCDRDNLDHRHNGDL